MRLLTILFLICLITVSVAKKRGKKRKKINEEMRRQMEEIEQARQQANSNPKVFEMPVPFGHIFREGFEDPTDELRQPIDLLELNTVYLKDGPFARELIKEQGKGYQVVQRSNPYMPAMALRDEEDEYDDSDQNATKSRRFWKFADNLYQNIHAPELHRSGKRPIHHQGDVGPAEYTGKSDYFDKVSYGLATKEKEEMVNFTTCDEFGRFAKFHPNDIVHLDWVPFYIWATDIKGKVAVARVHNFTYPTKKLVKTFKDDFSRHLNKTINWQQPKLLLRDGLSEVLLVAADRNGLYDGIPYHDVPPHLKDSNVVLPLLKMRLKIVDPYLAMMYCDQHYVTLMAVSGTEPKTRDEAISESSTLKIVGDGFPVKRNIEMEKQEERLKHIRKLERDQMKFINADEETAARK